MRTPAECLSTPPWTDVRQHTPDPRNKHRVAPSHLRMKRRLRVARCVPPVSTSPPSVWSGWMRKSGHHDQSAHSSAIHVQTRDRKFSEPTFEERPLSVARPQLTGSLGVTGPRSGRHTSANRSRMIRAVCLRPDTQRYGGNRPGGSSRRATLLRERRRHHSERHPIQSRTNSKGRSHRH
jgi:hypothetical protein